jgi:hypothetical protein
VNEKQKDLRKYHIDLCKIETILGEIEIEYQKKESHRHLCDRVLLIFLKQCFIVSDNIYYKIDVYIRQFSLSRNIVQQFKG